MSQQVSRGRLIPAAILAILVYGMIAAMLGTLLPELSKRFSLTPEQNGMIALAQAIGLIIASVSVGPLIDNKGKKTGLLLGLALIAISLFLLPSAGGYGMIMGLVLLLGLGGGIIVTAANALVSDISEERRASTLNLLNLFFGLGRPAHSVHRGEPAARQHDRPLLHGGRADGRNAHPALRHPRCRRPPAGRVQHVGSRSAAGPSRAVPAVAVPVPLCDLRSGRLELAAAAPDRARHRRNARAQHPLAGLRARPAGGPRRGLAHPDQDPAATVTLFASVLMAGTTYGMLQTSDPTMAGVLVFCAGLAMAPVFPTTLAMVGDAFPRMTATAMGIVITRGWIGLAVSSRVIGAMAATTRRRSRPRC